MNWLIIALTSTVILLILLLWSARTQRYIRVKFKSYAGLSDIQCSLEQLTATPIMGGNAIEILQNGDGFFPRLLEDISNARHSIHIESYVWWKGDICNEIAEALISRADAGVEVRLLLDWFGSFIADGAVLQRMSDSKISLFRYHSPELKSLGRLNKRTHRKLAIFDGNVAYVHSFGIAQQWTGDGVGPNNWRDTGVRLQGPIVNRVQGAFAQNWMECSGDVFIGNRYFPVQAEAGDIRCHLVSSSPRGGVSSVSLLLRVMIGVASKTLVIQNPYFCPGDDWIDALTNAVESGVDVRIMVPGHKTDALIVLHAGQHQYEKLLRAGCRVFLHQANLLHQKVMIIDGEWSHVGSTNFDERSFDINAETSLGIYSTRIAGELQAAFDEDMKYCEEVVLEDWMNRSLGKRVVEQIAFSLRNLI